ncbi:hypothetical protein GLOIN_2v1780032 [Rhizophagus irregularis DAOM 181602=DAOM 197198]|nr:hypothetical protein GLOIN_2v1780032 [Rhizophagus irregularis DAOM 181602=DAOM 197198]
MENKMLKCPTLSLPTLDIMHRNYPAIIGNNSTLCFFCDNIMESNDHLWTCSEIRDIIIDCFKRIGYKLIDLIRQHADKHSLTITDSIRYSRRSVGRFYATNDGKIDGYINPYNDFRNFKQHRDFLYILFSSSNFLHSGPFFKHLECTEIIDYSSPTCTDAQFIYNVNIGSSIQEVRVWLVYH